MLLVPIESLGELVEDVVVLRQQLARNIEADGIRAVLADDAGEVLGGEVHRVVPGHAFGLGAARRAPHRMQQPGLARHRRRSRQVQGRALGAEPAEVGRMVGVTAHADDLPALAADDDAAADAAVGAGGAGLFHEAVGRCGCVAQTSAGMTRPVSWPLVASLCRGRRRADAWPESRRHGRHRSRRATCPAAPRSDAAGRARAWPARARRDARCRRSTRTAKRGVQPLSGARALPSSRPMLQLCSGQATLVPNTMPCDSGPARWGQRSSSANTWSCSVRNRATSMPRARLTRREPSTGNVLDAADGFPVAHLAPSVMVISVSSLSSTISPDRRELPRVDARPCRTRTRGRARRRG